jgi:hypothetical protein
MKRKKILNIIGVLPILLVSFAFIITPAFADDAQMIYASASENYNVILKAPQGAVFDYVDFASYGTPELLKEGWCNSKESLSIVKSYTLGNNYVEIPATNSIFGDPCYGIYKWLIVYAHYLYLVDPNPTPTIDPSPTMTIEPSSSPTQTSSPEPTTSQTPTVEPSPSWTPTISPSPSPLQSSLTPSPLPTPIFSKTPEPVVTPTVIPEPVVSFPEATPTPSESPMPLDSPLPSNSAIPENNPSVNDTTDIKVQSILDNLVPGEAVTTENLDALGLTYADLPPETPVSLSNGVILTAKVADAIQIFNSPSAIVSAIFTDPGKALTAIANIGADMTPKVRKQSQKVVVASVIAAQVLSTTSVVGRVIK